MEMVLACVAHNLQIPEDQIIIIVQGSRGWHTRYGTSRPSLPPVARKTSSYLDFIADSTRATR